MKRPGRRLSEFEDKGLPASALKVVDSIYAQAKKEHHAGQLVKAVIHQLKYTDYKEENAFIKNLMRLQEEAASATFPVKPILHSMLGEMYWQYYQSNRYRVPGTNRKSKPVRRRILRRGAWRKL